MAWTHEGFSTWHSFRGRRRFLWSMVLCFVVAIVLLVWR
jgi:hypothetical protein